VEHRGELIPQIQEVMVTQSTEEWCARFQGAVFPYGPVNKMSDVFQDPQVKHSCLEQSVSHPTLGSVAMVGPAVTYSRTENKIRGSPPLLGQHTDKVLSDRLGLSQEEILHLRKEGVVS